MYNKHELHVLKNSFPVEQCEKVDFKNFRCLVLDTESCTKYKDDETSAKVYGWGLGAIYTDHMVYGETLEQFLDCVQKIFTKNLKFLTPPIKKKKGKYPSVVYQKIPVAVHNLKWDLEFFKYTLAELGYIYLSGNIVCSKDCQRVVSRKEEKSYHIVQNNGIVYGAEIYLPIVNQIKNRDNSKTDICFILDLFDFLKIVVDKVENFPKYLDEGVVDEMFYKMKEDYDYTSYREDGHVQNMLELRYQYNDIYMLRKVIEEYYIKILLDGEAENLNRFRTQSSIAFNKLKLMTFNNTDDTENEYRKYFELDLSTNFENTRKRIERESYKGGYTHCSNLYLGKDIKRRGCSLDINSSYPHKMASKLLPYGRPKRSEYGKIPNIDKENQVFLIEIAFDFVRPKSKKSELEIFKIGSDNIKALAPIVGNVSGQEYFYTNIKDNNVIEVNQIIKGSRLTSNYQMVVTSAEYEFMIKNYDFGTFKKDDDGFVLSHEIEFNGLELGEVLVYKAEKGKLANFINYYTEQKIKNKKLGNASLTQCAKTMLNSSYGKFGTKVNKEEKNLVYNEKRQLFQWSSMENGKYEAKEYYYPMASFITSYGRLMLWEAIIYAVGVENFIYCDTDSIYCFVPKNKLISRMQRNGFLIHPYILGGWDIESNFDRFKAIGQKKYMYHSIDYKKGKCKGNQIRCCGLPKKVQEEIAKEGFEEFHLGREIDGKQAKVSVYGGCLLKEVKFQLNLISW